MALSVNNSYFIYLTYDFQELEHQVSRMTTAMVAHTTQLKLIINKHHRQLPTRQLPSRTPTLQLNPLQK